LTIVHCSFDKKPPSSESQLTWRELNKIGIHIEKQSAIRQNGITKKRADAQKIGVEQWQSTETFICGS
jgi:hypothetical protein